MPSAYSSPRGTIVTYNSISVVPSDYGSTHGAIVT